MIATSHMWAPKLTLYETLCQVPHKCPSGTVASGCCTGQRGQRTDLERFHSPALVHRQEPCQAAAYRVQSYKVPQGSATEDMAWNHIHSLQLEQLSLQGNPLWVSLQLQPVTLGLCIHSSICGPLRSDHVYACVCECMCMCVCRYVCSCASCLLIGQHSLQELTSNSTQLIYICKVGAFK